MLRNCLFSLGCAFVLAGCGSSRPYGALETPTGQSSNIAIVRQAALPAPQSADIFDQLRPYHIGPFDELEIGVFGVEPLERKLYRVDAAGRISYPLVGTIEAAGMTLAQLEEEIASRLRDGYVREPQVFANLSETRSQVVTVSGQVQQPGVYPIVGKMTLMQAVATAKGLDDFAKRSEVVVFRDVGDQKYAAIYDLGAIEHGNYADPEIFARDIVVVGESAQRRALRDVVGAAPAILAPLLVTLTNGN